MKYFILILACLCAMSCSRQTTGIDAFVSQYDQASVRIAGHPHALGEKETPQSRH